MGQLKRSKYSFIVEKEDGNYVLYSSLTGVVILIDDEKYKNMVKNISENEIFDYEDNEFYNTLLEKKIIVKPDCDESFAIRALYEQQICKNNILEIMLIVTRDCNFRCVYCGQPHINREMKEETYESVLKFIKNQVINYGYRKVRISFFGGEPLLKVKNIIGFSEKLEALLHELSTPQCPIEYEAGMTTNGYLLTPDVFETLASHHCFGFQISVDGMPDVHNKMRPLLSGAPTWQRIIDNLTYMISTDKKFNVILRTNFNIDVAESMIDFYGYIKDNLKDDRISIYYETIKDQGNELTPNLLNDMDGTIFNIDMAKILRENNLKSTNSTSLLAPCSRVCYASKPNYFIIDEKQQILKCSFDLDYEKNIIGKLNDDGSFILNNDMLYDWIYKDFTVIEKCIDCKLLPLCFGKRCPRKIVEDDNIFCNIEMLETEIEGLLENYF